MKRFFEWVEFRPCKSKDCDVCQRIAESMDLLAKALRGEEEDERTHAA